jgi:hypothetical protein
LRRPDAKTRCFENSTRSSPAFRRRESVPNRSIL